MRAVRPSDLDNFYVRLLRRGVNAGRPLSAQSVPHVHALIRRLLNYVLKWGWVLSNPATNATPPSVRKPRLSVPSVDTVTRIIDFAHEQNPEIGCFFRLAAMTGARRGELCAIRWRDIDKSGVVTIKHSIVDGRVDELLVNDTKTHSSRKVSIDAVTLKILNEHHVRCEVRAKQQNRRLSRNEFVFASSVDSLVPLRPHRVSLTFRRLCHTMGLECVRLHDLQHFAATQMLVSGIPVKTVAGRLGHANVATTLNVYAHALESADLQAAEILSQIMDERSSA